MIGLDEMITFNVHHVFNNVRCLITRDYYRRETLNLANGIYSIFLN